MPRADRGAEATAGPPPGDPRDQIVRGTADGATDLALDLRIRVRRATGARPDRGTLRTVCENVLRGEGIHGACLLTVAIVTDEEIHRLNLEHRQVDRPTDVLSFSLVDPTLDVWGFVTPPGEPRELGDVVVSYPRVLAQAEEYGHSPARELAYLVAHGLLHILGHDHEEEAERAVMRRREEAALAPVGLTR
jgi:probable rRNA maturation factor